MNVPVKKQKTSFLGHLTGLNGVLEEKSRLEAFLSAVPGHYCGFAGDSIATYSHDFPSLFELDQIRSLQDISHSLQNDDSITLETSFASLQQDNKNFNIVAQLRNSNKYIEIDGTYGVALDGKEHFYILWAKDVTQEHQKIAEKAEHHSKTTHLLSQYTAVMDDFPSALWIRDKNQQITWCNKKYAHLLGDDIEDILRDQKEVSFSQKGNYPVRSVRELAEKAIAEKTPQDLECHIIAGGKRRFVQICEHPLEDNTRTFGIILDKSKEDELHTRIDRYLSANERLLEQLRASIVLFDSNQKLEFFNSAFAQLWGLEEQWLNNNPKLGDILEKLRETRRLPEQADFRSYKQSWIDMFTRLIDPHEDMMYLPDGSALRFLVVPHPMGGLMMIFEDVTSRLELESSYNTLIAVQKETLDNLAEGVAVYGTDGRLKLSNPSFRQLWKLNPEDVEGEPHVSVLVNRMIQFFADDRKERKRELITSHAIERSIQEGRISRKDDTLLEYSTVPLPDGGILVSYFDVTDSVKVENALREKNIALETAEQLKTDFLANVSYQLRTPLNAMIGFAEILDNQYFGELNDKQSEYTSGIQEAGGKLVRLIDDILDLSTIEAGYLDLAMSEFSIAEMLQTLYTLTDDWARKEEIAVNIDCPADIGSLIADERRLKQVLLNLIHNAITYTPEKGTIDIAATRTDEHIQFIVTDTGIGISQKDLERIFEPFERATIEHRADMSAAALSRGAGLGLSLVKNIIELHGGTVGITSEEEKGTKVTLTLPVDPVLEPMF